PARSSEPRPRPTADVADHRRVPPTALCPARVVADLRCPGERPAAPHRYPARGSPRVSEHPPITPLPAHAPKPGRPTRPRPAAGLPQPDTPPSTPTSARPSNAKNGHRTT